MRQSKESATIDWPQSIRSWQLIYCISCILFALTTTLAIVISGADCLTSSQANHSVADRVLVVKSAATSKKAKESTFKEVFNEMTVSVKENTPIGSKLCDISANNHTDLLQDQILYAIVGGPDMVAFSLRSDNQLNKVELVNEINFDYESQKNTYKFFIRATSLYLRYELEVNIIVTDENDNKPQFEDFSIVFNNYKNNFPTSPIGRVPASDADINDQLRYRVVSGNNAQLVVVNETNGDIQLSPWLNSNVPMMAVIGIIVSDGSNEAVAHMVLTVNLITEPMLQNSVVLRLDGVGREEFLTRKYETFLNSMVRILGPSDKYSKNDIVVFDVEESIQESLPTESLMTYRPYHKSSISNSTLSVNVSFSARADGNDVEAYLPAQYIEERIHMNRALLSQALDVSVAPFQDNLCLHEPCQAYQECHSIHKFDRAPKTFVTTANMIFRPIKASQSFVCTCPPTFTGMKHKNECNLQINECLSNPCLNGGICHMHESGYACECKPGFVGARCEHSFANSTCQAISSSSINSGDKTIYRQQPLCSGKSRCLNNTKSYFNSAKTGQLSVSSSGFSCQGCPYPFWSNELCQLRARSFTKNSYITLPSLRRRHRFHLTLRFATFQTDALLLYNGRYNDKHDFIALEIVDTVLKFSYSLGTTVNTLTLPSISVSNGDWHTVVVDYKDRNVTLLINECDPVIDEALAKIQGSISKRCSNSSYSDPNSTERTLDLTGPMQLGSLLPLPIEFPVSAPSFIGCLSDFHIDHLLVDLYNPIQDIGTQPGCPDKRNFCQQHSCNGHPCHDSWGAARCSCGDEYLGKSCETLVSNEKVRKFNGNSYLAFSPIESTVPAIWKISMHFRTINPNGVLMKISLDPDAIITLELVNGGIRLTQKLQNLSVSKVSLDDGEWHFVELTWSSDYAQMQVDQNPNLSVQSSEMGNISGSIAKLVIIGASQTVRSSESPSDQTDYTSSIVNLQPSDFPAVYQNNTPQSFVGCIYGFNISDNSELWITSSDERNVERGCQTADICDSNPCPPNSKCVRRGMNQHKCICHPGFVGDRCLPICELHPCQGENSRCIPNSGRPDVVNFFENLDNIPSEYQCECENLRTGKNCEQVLQQRCPSNWRGRIAPGTNSSICEPCNCDESKGFDGDCDKTTGQCLCKSDHYQPEGSDYCVPCNCYKEGSKVSSCDQKTGQCKCRSGVVGRRCDACAGQYAEVTLRGCQVIYDACPKTFSNGVWWEKTPLDTVATQQCPASTSTGTATRLCDKTDSWREPYMFDCISNTFTDLYNQYQVFEGNKFPMTTGLAVKIANDLKLALNETVSSPSMQLFGSDMYISFRLIHHLIQHESRQTGLNLTHRQDRSYIRNIVESISYILDPAYAENWPEIAKREPKVGAEYLLKLMDTLGRVLIESQSDTFTKPFEVRAKFVTFGFDKLPRDQSGELGKSNVGSLGGLPAAPYATDPLTPNGAHLDSNGYSNEFDSKSQYTNEVPSSFSDRLSGKESPALIVPKQDGSIDSSSLDQSSKAIIPLKTLRLKTNPDLSGTSYFQARSRAKRDELIVANFNFPRQQPALVAYSIFQTLGPLLPNSHDHTVHHELGTTANAPVIWLTVRPADNSDFLDKNVSPKINYVLRTIESSGKTRPQCAIWDFSPQSPSSRNHSSYNAKQSGKFSTKGCEVIGIQQSQRARFRYDYVNCSCDHIGAVTVLMDNANYAYLITGDPNTRDSLQVVAICLSVVILGCTYIVLTFVRGHTVKSNSNSINKNLIFILIMIELLILFNLLARGSLSQRENQCKLVAIFLHHFSISLFFWLFVNAVHFYRMLTELRDINHGPMKFYHVIGYAIPAFFVSIAVGLRIEQFGKSGMFCWLSPFEPIIWSMFGPIGLISFFTLVLFLMALCKTLPDKEDPSGAELLKNHMVINIIKTPLISVYWLVMVYVVNEAFYIDWEYFFPILTVLKSVALLMLLCVVDKHIRYNLYVSWLRFRGENIPFMEDSPDYAANRWMPSIEEVDKNYTYGGFTGQVMTPGFQNSNGDIYQPEIIAFSAASTTSRSTTSETSSSAYQHRRIKDSGGYGRTGRSKHRRRSKRTHHKHHHHKHHHRDRHHHHHRSHRHHDDKCEHYDRRHYEDSHVSHSSRNYLASSHSSDDDDVSVMPKKIYSSGNLEVVTNDGRTQAPESSNFESQDDRQTVPMELAASSVGGTDPTQDDAIADESAQTSA